MLSWRRTAGRQERAEQADCRQTLCCCRRVFRQTLPVLLQMWWARLLPFRVHVYFFFFYNGSHTVLTFCKSVSVWDVTDLWKYTTVPSTSPQKNTSGFIKASPSQRWLIHSHYGRQSHKSIWDKLSGTNGRAEGEQVKGLQERFVSSRASCLVVQQEGWDEAGDKI